MQIKIVKLGGAATSQKLGFENISHIFEQNSKYTVVVSAFGKTTRKLADAAYTAANGNLKIALDLLDDIFNFHLELLESVSFRSEKLFDNIRIFKDELTKIINSIAITKELTPRILDKVICYGELIALEIIFSYLESKDFSVKKINSADIFITDSNYNRANLNYEKSTANINRIIRNEFNSIDIIVIQGFTAATEDGTPTTMGIESSNLTATVLAVTLNCDEIDIYSDVDGIRTIDPKISSNSKSILKLHYSDAMTAASNGLKLIYPQMIKQFFADDFISKKIIFRSLINPEADTTIISNEKAELQPLILVENDYYFNEFAHNDNKKSLLILKQILNNHYGFIKDINLSSGRIKISSWEKIHIENEIINYPDLSVIKILFINKQDEEKLINILKNYEVSEFNFNYNLQLVTLAIKTNVIENLAIELHNSLY